MKRNWWASAALAVVLTLLVTALLTGGATAVRAGGTTVAGSATFNDVPGDAGGGPDVTTVAVADDMASGMIQVSVTAPGYQQADPASEPDVSVWLNTDKNDLTGSVTGSEYALVVFRDTDGAWYEIARWTDNGWQSVPESSTMSSGWSGDTQTWRFNKNDIGGATGFTFFVTTGVYDATGNVLGHDLAPDTGKWTYDVSTTPVIGLPVTTPSKALAGKKLTVSFPVTRADSGKPLSSGTMICDPSVKGKVLMHAESFTNGTAKLSFTIPKTAKGKTVVVKVTIKFGDQSATRIASFKVR